MIDPKLSNDASRVIAKYEWPVRSDASMIQRARIRATQVSTRGAALRLQSVDQKTFSLPDNFRPGEFGFDLDTAGPLPEYTGWRGWLQRVVAGSRLERLYRQIVDFSHLFDCATRMRMEMLQDLATLKREFISWRDRAVVYDRNEYDTAQKLSAARATLEGLDPQEEQGGNGFIDLLELNGGVRVRLRAESITALMALGLEDEEGTEVDCGAETYQVQETVDTISHLIAHA